MADNNTSECTNGYSGGSLAGAIVGTFAATLILLGLIYLVWEWQKKRRIRRSGLHNLVIVEDGGGGGGGGTISEGGDTKEFAYDNPGFIDESSEAKKSHQGGGLDAVKFNDAGKSASQQNGGKRMPWGPLSFLFKSRSALDDSVVEEPQKYSVALKGHDFTGLGFNIIGNMRDGIFVKDIMQRGPAAESREILAGDQITGMTVSFKQMVLEDAITLLSYASPYEVTLEMLRLPEKSLPHKGIFVSSPTHPSATSSGQSSTLERVCHPFFKSQSIDDLRKVGKEHLDLQVDRKKKQANGLHASKGTVTPTTATTVSSGTMEIPTVVVVGNNENRSSSSTPSKGMSSTVKLPKLPKLSFSFGSPKSVKAPEAHQKSSSSSSPASAQVQIPMPDEVDGPIVSVTKPEVVPRSKTKSTLVQRSTDDLELVEAISPAIDKMTADFEKSKMIKVDIPSSSSSSTTAVLDVQPIEIDMKGQPSVKVENSGGDASANIDIRTPSMQMVMPGTKKSKEKEGKKKDKKSSKQKSLDIDLTPPSLSLKAGMEMGEGESETQQDVKKPQRGQKSKDKSEKSKEKEGKASKADKEPKNKDNSKEQEQGESTATTSGEKSKFFKFGIPVLPDISFGFGGSKSSDKEDKDKNKDKDKEGKDKEMKEGTKAKTDEKFVEISPIKVEVPKVSLEVQQKSPELDVSVQPIELPTVSKNDKKEKEPKEKSKSKDKKKEKERKESKSEQPSITSDNEANQQPEEQPPQKEKSGSSFSFNIKLPSFDKPLLKRKDSSGSVSGETSEKVVVDSSPNASGANKDASDAKSPKDDKPAASESSPSKPKKKSKAEKKSSSRPTSPEVSDGHRTTDDEAEKAGDIIDTVPGEKSSKRGSGFHMPHIGIKLPKFGHSKQTYSFENLGENKHGHGPVAESLLEGSPSMKMEVSANTPEFKKMTPTVDEIVPEVAVKMDQAMAETTSEVKKAKDEVDSSEVKVEVASPNLVAPSISLDMPSASVKLEATKEGSSAPSESAEKVEMEKAGDDDASKKEQDGKDKELKESKPSFVSKGLKGLRDFKEKVAHRLSHDHQQASSSSENEAEPGDENKMGKEKVKKEKKSKESQEKSKEDKQREKEEKLKEKERLKAEKRLKKAELKRTLSSGGQQSSSSSSSSEDEGEDGAAAKMEKKAKKKSRTKESKKKSVKKEKKGEKAEKNMSGGIEVKAEMPGIEVQAPEVTASSPIEQKQLSGHEAKLIPVKPPVVPRKSKDESGSAKAGEESSEAAITAKPKIKKTKSKGGSSSSSSSSSESDSENKKERKEGKPKKPKRTPKRKAPEIPHASLDVPDIVKITTSAEVISPPKEETSASKSSGGGEARESTPTSKTPESGRRSASFGDLSSLQQPKSKGDGPLERAMSVDMAGDKEQAEPGTMPVGSSFEDLSVISDSRTISHLTREQHHLQGLRDSMASKSSTSSNETLKASATSVVQVHPKENTIEIPTVDISHGATSAKITISGASTLQEAEKVDPQSSTIQNMMNETISVMNNIVHEMDSPSLVKSAMRQPTTSSKIVGFADDTPRVTFSTSESVSLEDKSEAEKVAQEVVDDIMEKASQKSEAEKVAKKAIDDIMEQASQKSEAEKVAKDAIDDIMEQASQSLSDMSVSFGEREKDMEEPKVSVTTGNINDTEPGHSLDAEMEGGADSFSIATVKIQGMDADSDEPVSVRNITVTNIKSEPKPAAENVEDSEGVEDPANKQLLREDSRQRLLQTVADANNIKVAPATPLRKDSSLSSSSCSVDSSPDTKLDNGSPLKPNFSVEVTPTDDAVPNGKSNGQTTIEISSDELDGIMMSHADFLQKQAVAGAGASAQEESIDEGEAGPLNQQLKDTFDSWVYVEQKNAANEHTCPHSHSDPEPSTASSNDDDDSPYGRNGAMSPTTYRMETEYKFETSEMRVTSSPIPPEDAQVKSQATVYSTTMTLPQKTVTQITLGDPVIDAGGRIVSKITLDTSSQNVEDNSNANKAVPGGNAEVDDLGKLPELETLK